jgi:hypothetical protein
MGERRTCQYWLELLSFQWWAPPMFGGRLRPNVGFLHDREGAANILAHLVAYRGAK